MGVDYDMADTLLHLRSKGVSFDSVLTLGRQGYLGSRKGTKQLFEKHGLECTWLPPNPYPQNYSEGLFAALGAKDIQSLDITNAEKPTILHDLNKPVPEALHNRFDIVMDGGTLEHIFDVQNAFFNCMRMVRVGGKLVIDTVANNLMGHGFYQFSPELFFSLLSELNGFKIDSVTVIEHSPRHRKFEVVSPSVNRKRFETITFWRTSMICVATKQADRPLTSPQQSDYDAAFTMSEGNSPWDFYKPTRLERFFVENFPRLTTSLKGLKFSAIRQAFRLDNKTAFTKI